MSDIPNLVPNANITEGIKDETIRVTPTNLVDIKIDKPANCSIDSMACTGVGSIGDIKINL